MAPCIIINTLKPRPMMKIYKAHCNRSTWLNWPGQPSCCGNFNSFSHILKNFNTLKPRPFIKVGKAQCNTSTWLNWPGPPSRCSNFNSLSHILKNFKTLKPSPFIKVGKAQCNILITGLAAYPFAGTSIDCHTS